MSDKKLKEYACVCYEALKFELKHKDNKNAVYYIGHIFYGVVCYVYYKRIS